MNFELYNPADVGVNPLAVSKLLDMFIDGTLAANAMVMLRHNKVFCEFYRTPFNSGKYHSIASITKSIVSIAAGFAVNEGLFNTDSNVAAFFPEIVKRTADENIYLMKIENLLTMTSGHKTDMEFEGVGTGDITKDFLLTPLVNKPGDVFSYNTDGVIVLSRIIERTSGTRFDDYIHERLFKPLGIKNYLWETDRANINTGFGLYLTARDLAKIGMFLLNGGKWNKQQLLNPEWIKTASSYLYDNGDFGEGNGYGYLFWRQKPKDSFAAIGLGGQYCAMLPNEDMVIALFDAYGTLNVIWDTILPGLDGTFTADISLNDKCNKISFKMPKGDRYNNIASAVDGKKYSLESNMLKITHISFDFNKYEVSLSENEKSCVCKIGFGEWIESETYADPYTALSAHYGEVQTPVFIAGAWKNDVFHMRLIFASTLATEDMYITFSEDSSKLTIDYKSNNKVFIDPDKIIEGVVNT